MFAFFRAMVVKKRKPNCRPISEMSAESFPVVRKITIFVTEMPVCRQKSKGNNQYFIK